MRSYAVERRKVPHQYEVMAAVPGSVLDGHNVRRGFDDAELRVVPPACAADRAQLVLAEHAAALAAPDALNGL